MDSRKARQLFHAHASALAYVAVTTPTGDAGIGSAFHVGEGVFITARHVVHRNTVTEIRIPQPVGVRAKEIWPDLSDDRLKEWDRAISEVHGEVPLYKHFLPPLEVAAGPYFAADERVDVAAFTVRDLHHNVGVARLGIHWDDWVFRAPWHLSDALILGFPPIPMTTRPELVAARAEVHTFTTLRSSPHIHFILSAVPRGGFSGGLALHEDGFALGVITSGLVRDGQAPETGFFAVLSIEPIRILLEQHDLLPEIQRQYERDVLNIDELITERRKQLQRQAEEDLPCNQAEHGG